MKAALLSQTTRQITLTLSEAEFRVLVKYYDEASAKIPAGHEDDEIVGAMDAVFYQINLALDGR